MTIIVKFDTPFWRVQVEFDNPFWRFQVEFDNPFWRAQVKYYMSRGRGCLKAQEQHDACKEPNLATWMFRRKVYSVNKTLVSRNDHTIVTAPLPVCSAKLSTIGPG